MEAGAQGGGVDAGTGAEQGEPLERGLAEGRTANRAIGYREVMGFLAGDRTLAEAVEQTKTATRRFARRQDSWFQQDPRIHWLAYDRPDLVSAALEAAGLATATVED